MMISIARIFLISHLYLTTLPAASSEGLRGGGDVGGRRRELPHDDGVVDDYGGDNPPLINGTDTDVHHQASHVSAGIRKEQRIIGGNKASANRYLYTVALMDDRGLFCGGVLVSKDVVLTAAHCAMGNANVEMFVGSSRLMDRAGEIVYPTKGWVHPKFDMASLSNDFAIYLLGQPAPGDVEVIALSDNSKSLSRGSELVALGWGDTNSNPGIYTGSNDLLRVGVGYIPNNECTAKTGYIGSDFVSYRNQIGGNMLCALGSGKDGCQGDSGGPLIIEGNDSRGRNDVLVGVSSWGVYCAHDTLPGVYARVSDQYEWIKGIVCKNSKDPADGFTCGGRTKGDDDDGKNDGNGNGSGNGGNNGKGGNGGKGKGGGKGGNKGKGGGKGGNKGKGSNGGKGKGNGKKGKGKGKKKNPNNKKTGQGFKKKIQNLFNVNP